METRVSLEDVWMFLSTKPPMDRLLDFKDDIKDPLIKIEKVLCGCLGTIKTYLPFLWNDNEL